MPRLTEDRVPKYRLHKQSGQAIVTLSGRDYLLGPYKSKSSKTRYDRLIAEWIAVGRQPLHVGRTADATSVTAPYTILNLSAAYWRHCKAYYPRNTRWRIKSALAGMKKLYSELPAAEFSPLKMKAIRQTMLEDAKWCRRTINEAMRIIRHCFKWAASNELVPGSVYHSLLAVEGLRRGRSEARESKPVKPVPEAWVEVTMQHLSPVVQDMIRLQLLTGMRPGELCIMRGCDIDTSGTIWTYTPATHKTAYLDHQRTVYLGPEAKKIVSRRLKPDLQAYLFSPHEADEWHRQQKHKRRQTPAHHGNAPGDNRKRRPKRAAGDRYDVTSYRRAIARACDLAFPPHEQLARKRVPANGRKAKSLRWETAAEYKDRLMMAGKWKQFRQWQHDHRWHPNQLRHNAATRLRREYGIDVAQTILGHRLGSNVTEIYAEANIDKAKEVLAKIG